MKHLQFLPLSMLFAVNVARAEEDPPKDFADIKWGETAEAAKAKILLKPGVKFTTASPDGATLSFEGGTFATMPATKWEFTFDNGKFSKGCVYLTPTDTAQPGLQKAYETLNTSITAKYKKPGREEHDSGNHSATYWDFQNRRNRWQITCDVDPKRPGILLIYSFAPLEKAGSDKKAPKIKDL